MALAYSPNGEFLLSGGLDAVLKIWEVHKGFAPVQTINAHWLHINAIQYSPAGHYFATASMDKTLKIWDADTFELLKVLDKEKYDGHTSSVNKILWVDDKVGSSHKILYGLMNGILDSFWMESLIRFISTSSRFL